MRVSKMYLSEKGSIKVKGAFDLHSTPQSKHNFCFKLLDLVARLRAHSGEFLKTALEPLKMFCHFRKLAITLLERKVQFSKERWRKRTKRSNFTSKLTVRFSPSLS